MAFAEQARISQPVREPFAPAATLPPEPLCPLCGSSETSPAFRDNGCELRACRACELFFVHPYPAAVRQHERVASGVFDDIALLDCQRRYEGERFYFERHFPLIAEELRGAASLLDVGCGTGHLLERLSGRAGLHRVGIELNHEAAQFARRVAHCEILEIPLEDYRPARPFDAITLINVFSHIPSFANMFRALRGAVAPGGKVILRTSEMSPHVSRWNQFHWGVPDDLHFLGLGTLEFLCAHYGFRIARHVRTPFEEELFYPSRWRQMGRNRWLNLVKRAAVHVPGALPLLRTVYAAALGDRMFVSFIVLEPTGETGNAQLEARSRLPVPVSEPQSKQSSSSAARDGLHS